MKIKHRLYLPQNAGSSFQIDVPFECNTEQTHYLLDVLRLKEGQSIEVCGRDGVRWIANIGKKENKTCFLHLQERLPERKKSFPLILMQGLPKLDKFEQIIRQVTELGVVEIYPILSQFSVIKLDDQKANKKKERWDKILLDATRQSQRDFLPILHETLSLQEAIEKIPAQYDKIFCWELEGNWNIKQWSQTVSEPQGVVFFVGPEGGISEEEALFLQNNNFVSVHLGDEILRTETAGVAVASMLLFAFGLQ